jgi:PEP-CTERM motif-containing protein
MTKVTARLLAQQLGGTELFKRFALVVAGFALMFIGARPASAAIIGTATLDDCAGCQDMDFSLSLDLTGSLYTLTYVMEESDQNDFNLNRVSAIDFKINTGTLTGLMLTTVPTGKAWTVEPGEHSAGNGDGCQGSGNGFNCASANGAANFVAISASPLTWVFTFTGVTGGSLFTDASTWHIGAKFNDADGGTNGHIISLEGGSSTSVPVPEPTTMALVGLGALGLVVGRRRS